MSGFTHFKHGDCPICNGASKNCRQSQSTSLIFCRDTSVNPTGYIYRGDDVHGFGMWQASSDAEAFTSQAKDERNQQRREFLEASLRRQQQQIKQQMPAIQRDKWYRKLLDQMVLTDVDREKLLARGLTPEQIIRDGYRSLTAWQKVKKDFPPNLPGILPHGAINAHADGILCPIPNKDGLIISCQIRLHDGTDGRYRWLTSATKNNLDGVTSHLDGELPLGVFYPAEAEFLGEEIWLTEGTSIKPSITSKQLGVPVLGAASGRFDTSPETAKATIEHLSTKYSTKVLTFAVDAGDVANTCGVSQRWLSQFDLFQKLGYQCRVAWWGQVDKSFSDIDELKPLQLSDIRYLSIEEFKELCIKWGGLIPSGTDFYKATNNSTSRKTDEPTDYSQRVASAQRKLHTLSYPADLICDPAQKYLPNLVGKIPTKGIVFPKSPKGSGKSHQIEAIKQHCCGWWSEKITIPEVPELPPEQLNLLAANKQTLSKIESIVEKVWNKGLGMKFVSINARIALGREQAIRWEFTYIEDADIDGGKEEFGVKLATESIIENINEIGLCVDSLAKLKHRDWSNTLIVIDEIELVLNHISTSSTCREKRSEILQVLQDKIKESLDNGGLLIGADADITDVTCDYFKALVPNHPPFIVKHDFKGDPWSINYYTGKRDIILSQIEKHLEDPECEPIALAVDNQKEAEALSIHLIRKYPYLAREIGGLIRIDSKVTQQDYGKEFVKRPNESIQKYQPKILIYTPSLGVGCSIDIHYFGHVYGLFFGNLEPSQCRQMLARIRDSVPRTIWAKVRAGNSENEATSYLPQDIKKRLFNCHDTAMVPLEQALAKARAEVEASGIDNPEDKDILPVLIETLQKMQGADGSWNNPHVDLYCNQVARRNFSLSQLAVQLRQELIDEGHHIIDEEGDEKTNAGEAVTQAKEEIKQRESNLTANAEDIPFEDAQELKRKAARTTEEEHKINKAFLKHDLPEFELTPDFIYKSVHKDHGRWLAKVKLDWHLQNRDALANKDEKHWKSKLSQFSRGVTCLWDVRTDTPKVEAIIKSGVLDWVKADDLEAEYSSESESGQQFLKKALASKKQLWNALGITVKDDSIPIKLANRILDRLGIKLAYSTRTNAIKYYKLDEELVNDPDRKAVFEALNLKWKNEVVKMAEAKAQQSTQPVTNENNFLYKNEASSPNNKPEELAQNSVVEHTTEEWLTPKNLADTASLLSACDNPEMLADVRAAVPPYALKAACKLLPKLRLIQIKQWVLQLNSVMIAQIEETAYATQPSQQQGLVTDENLADAVALLETCQSAEMLGSLRDCFSDFVIQKACELVPLALKRWVCSWLTYWQSEAALI